jgi:dolichol-phosphate mannosyltransferase
MKISLIIPCYNEVDGIHQLTERLRLLVPKLATDHEVEIIFVDDGSIDGTAGQIRLHASGLPYTIVAHEQNRGLGAALRTGFSVCSGDEIVTMDSDCTYDPMDVIKLLKTLRSGYDVVTGSPYHPQGEVLNVSPWRLFLSKTLSRMYWIILPNPLYTYTSCFRAYKHGILTKLHFKSNGFLAVTEILVSAILQHAKVAEVPAKLQSRRFGTSKLKVVRVVYSHLKYLIRVLFWRVTGLPQT